MTTVNAIAQYKPPKLDVEFDLAKLQEIMRSATGEDPPPNNEGVVDQVHDDHGEISYVINFDDGGSAPYPAHETRRIG